jgi:DNA-binding GntR family transcriptional regulator
MTTKLPSIAVPVVNGFVSNGSPPEPMPAFPPIEVSSRRSQAWRVLRDSIVSGRLPAGTKLIGSQLAEQLGVSRTPLREALQLLEREGFVHRLPNGVVEVVGLSRDEVEEVYAIRARMEGLVTRYAAMRATPEEMEHVGDILSSMRRAARRGKTVELDALGVEFHDFIQRISRLRYTVKQLETMRDHIDRYRAQTINSPGRQDALLEEHADVVRWMEARDPARAEEAMRHHIWKAWETIEGATVPRQEPPTG